MKTFVLFLTILLPLSLSAQILSMPADETSLQFKVKQIDEFMRRFNFEETYDGSVPSNAATLEERLYNMYTVFRCANFYTEDGKQDSLVIDFCNYVVDNNLRLRYEDNNWTAEVVCSAKLNGKNQSVSLFLQTEQIKDVLYKWVLVDVNASFMKNLGVASKDSLFISPAEHGISFITLPRIINLSVSDVNTVFKQSWQLDRLSVFNYLITNGILSLKMVDKVLYHWDIGDYCFQVERFEGENSANQGWLISKIVSKCNK